MLFDYSVAVMLSYVQVLICSRTQSKTWEVIKSQGNSNSAVLKAVSLSHSFQRFTSMKYHHNEIPT